jgi:cytochrome b6-f complex iron-sulfur subunit
MTDLNPQPLSRRGFLQVSAAGLAAVATGLAAFMAARFVTPALPHDQLSDLTLDLPEKYPEGQTFIPAARIFVERRGNRLRCLSAECTHLGCIIAWNAQLGEFHCPCHGSVFSADGAVIKGPAARPLAALRLTPDAGGRLLVQRRTKVAPDQAWITI